VDVAHVLDDGGGRELAYVAMSRARTASHVYVTAANPRQAAERLTWNWDQQRRQAWITDRAQAAARAQQVVAELAGERDRLLASIPPYVTDQLDRVRDQITYVESDRADLHAAAGQWADGPVGHAYQALQYAERTHEHEVVRTQDRYLGLWARHRVSQAEQASAVADTQADRAWQETVRPHDDELGRHVVDLGRECGELEVARQARGDFLTANPGILDRIREIDHTISRQQHQLRTSQTRPPAESYTPDTAARLRQHAHLDHIHHQQITQAVEAPHIGGPGI
jgi:hypothetical protein